MDLLLRMRRYLIMGGGKDQRALIEEAITEIERLRAKVARLGSILERQLY
jgi:hypothetical protein